ncbi:MAG: WecB/TagA/CpsF family glycosyltransferase [Cognatishimia sp.]|uniref:WecB/TagA/CpsF family glycosyltransferase n=1 Tax=Cognatishimia sp. TaxID=2211648 RepID=UPI003B8CD737
MTYQSNIDSWKADSTKQNPLCKQVLGHRIDNLHTREAIAQILRPGRRHVAFLNAHCANVATHNPHYSAVLENADMVLSDGIGIELAAKLQGSRIRENLNGTDFVPKLLADAAKLGKSIYLLGGKPGTAERAAKALQRRIPNLIIAGTRDGYEGAQDHAAAMAINNSKADILLVAMGVPMQELWIDRNFERLNTQICLSVGGLFDFLAGNVTRAPGWVRDLRSEWMWRLLMEPRRMAKRYLIGNLTFLARAALWPLRRSDNAVSGKRVIDLTLSLGGLLVLGPVLLALMLAIRIESKGSPIFKQRRIGANGKPFTLYKLRSMAMDSEKRRAALLAQSDRDGVCFKAKSDPRVTRMGRFIRRYSLDELPQIVNVAKGDMSVVGPRPALPEEVAAYPQKAIGRLKVKPGLTGIWQVSGRADIGFDQMVDMDLAYTRSRTVWLDLILILATFRAVLTGRGAY